MYIKTSNRNPNLKKVDKLLFGPCNAFGRQGYAERCKFSEIKACLLGIKREVPNAR